MDQDRDDPRSPHPLAWALPLLPVAASVFGMSALLYYKVQAGGEGPGRNLLQSTVAGLYHTLGFVPSFMLCILVLSWSSIWFITGKLAQPWGRFLRVLTAAVALSLLVNLGSVPNPDGGSLGTYLVPRLVRSLGYALTTVLVVATTVAAMLLATDFFFYRHFEALGREVAERTRMRVRLDPASPDAELARTPEAGVAAFRTLDTAVTPEETLALDPPDFGVPESLRTAPEVPRRDELLDSETTAAAIAEHAPETGPAVPAVEPPPRAGWRSRLRIRLDDIPPAVATEDLILPEAGVESAASSPVEHEAPEAEPAAAQPAARVPDVPLAPPESEMAFVAAALSEPEPELPTEPTEPAASVEPEPALPAATPEPAPEPVLERAPAAEPVPEPAVEIPRPDAAATGAVRQGSLFGSPSQDEDLLEEARQLVVAHRRANVAFLRNRLRVRYEDAVELLRALAERGVVALDESGTQGRVLVGS